MWWQLFNFASFFFLPGRLCRTCFNEDEQVFVNDTVVFVCCFSCGFQVAVHL